MEKYFLLTFDLEEFTLPLEFGEKIKVNEIYSTSYKGCLKILKILDKLNVEATFFTTVNFGQRFNKIMNKIVNGGHEVALHYFFDSNKQAKNSILNHKIMLENIINDKISGFRGHMLKAPPFKILKNINLEYDSSIHPTFIPGRYNYLFKRTKTYRIGEIIEIPISVVPFVGLPFSFLWFRNFGLPYVKLCSQMTIISQEFLNMYFHPWEFVDISNYRIPFFMKRNCGKWMVHEIKEFLNWILERNFKCIKIKDFVESTKHSI